MYKIMVGMHVVIGVEEEKFETLISYNNNQQMYSNNISPMKIISLRVDCD